MLTRLELLALERSTRSHHVLSVYIDGTGTDVATQEKWRLDLANSLRDLRASLDGSPREEREAFDQCALLLDRELAAFPHAIGAPGWVAFISDTGVRGAERVPVATPTRAIWSIGASVAPYMRILKEARPVIVLMVDARMGRLYRYHRGIIEQVKSFHAHAVVDAPSHMGNAPRGGFHHGVHGVTARDAAQRSLHAGTQRMIREITHDAARLAAPDGWILTGGIPEVSRHLAGALERHAPGRVRAVEALDIHASTAQIASAARQGASALRAELDLERIGDIIEHATNAERAALGPAATRAALIDRRVRELYITHEYLGTHPDEAERAVRSALDQGAAIEHVSHGAARLLDEHGGMAAHLRFARRRRAP